MNQHHKQTNFSGSQRDPRKTDAAAAKRKKEIRLMVVMIILAVLMALAATVAALYVRWVRKPVLPGPDASPSVSLAPGQSADPEPSASELTEPDYDPVQPKVSGTRKSEDFYTILVYGTDTTTNLTDTMMVVSYDVTNQKASVMSLPRDTLVNVRRSYKKLNGVYNAAGRGEKGAAALKSEVSELLGFVPDYYVMIDWELVGKMVDAIDGVWFEVPWDMWYSDPYQDLHIDLKEGYQLLDGSKAMQLVRWRKNMDPVTFKILSDHSVGDVGRLDIQHNFLKAVLKQTLQIKNLAKISQLAKLFGENVVSDLTVENLFWFGSQAIMGGLNVDDVQFMTMPWRSGKDYLKNDYVFPVRSSLLTIINEQLNPFVDKVTLRELDLMVVNEDGTLSSSTGTLADPDMGVLPPSPSVEPDPDASGEPGVTPDPLPGDSDSPAVSAEPDPAVSENPGFVSVIPGASPAPDSSIPLD